MQPQLFRSASLAALALLCSCASNKHSAATTDDLERTARELSASINGEESASASGTQTAGAPTDPANAGWDPLSESGSEGGAESSGGKAIADAGDQLDAAQDAAQGQAEGLGDSMAKSLDEAGAALQDGAEDVANGAADAVNGAVDEAVAGVAAGAAAVGAGAGELLDDATAKAEGVLDDVTGKSAEALDDVTAEGQDALEQAAAAVLPIRTEGPAAVGETAPEFRLLDQNGTAHNLSDFRGRPVVLEWFNHGCPFVVKHYKSGNMQALQERYTEAGAVWLSICSSAEGKQGYTPQAELAAMVADRGMGATAVMADFDGSVGHLYEARQTPHMFVIDARGELVYAGAIDDNSSTDPATIDGATNYVAETLDALLAGETVEPRETQPYGCGVKY